MSTFSVGIYFQLKQFQAKSSRSASSPAPQSRNKSGSAKDNKVNGAVNGQVSNKTEKIKSYRSILWLKCRQQPKLLFNFLVNALTRN